MATAGSHLTEDWFLCSICLDVFTQPVSLPCGHNFCKACITDCWNSNVRGFCQCPMCNETYKTRPELRVNCLLSEMVEQFRKSVQVTEEKERDYDVPGGMLCAVCIDTKMKAVKSCLVCLTSYCETHLEPHRRVQTLKTHQLVEPLGSMEDRMCKKHNKILELFCRKEQMCICMLCSQTDHRSHDVVSLEDESGKRKAEMRKTKTECEQKIQERELELLEIRRSAEVDNEASEKETADSVEVLTALVASIQKRISELLKAIERKQTAVQEKAERSITELQREIVELQMTRMECEKLSRSEDPFEVLMYSLPSPSTLPGGIYCEVPLIKKLSAGTVTAAVAKMEKTLNEGMEALIKQLEEHLDVAPPLPPCIRPTPPPPLVSPHSRSASFSTPSSIKPRSLKPPSPKSAILSPLSIKPLFQPRPTPKPAILTPFSTKAPSLYPPTPKSAILTPFSIKPSLPPKPSAPIPDSSKALSPGEALARAFTTELQQLQEKRKRLKDKKREWKSEGAIYDLPE